MVLVCCPSPPRSATVSIVIDERSAFVLLSLAPPDPLPPSGLEDRSALRGGGGLRFCTWKSMVPACCPSPRTSPGVSILIDDRSPPAPLSLSPPDHILLGRGAAVRSHAEGSEVLTVILLDFFLASKRLFHLRIAEGEADRGGDGEVSLPIGESRAAALGADATDTSLPLSSLPLDDRRGECNVPPSSMAVMLGTEFPERVGKSRSNEKVPDRARMSSDDLSGRIGRRLGGDALATVFSLGVAPRPAFEGAGRGRSGLEPIDAGLGRGPRPRLPFWRPIVE